MDITKQVKDLIDITTKLTDLLKRENQALRNHDTQEATSLLSEKNGLTEIYEDHVRAVMDHSLYLDNVAADLKERLSSIGETAKTLIEENAVLLRAAIVANQRIMDMVADALSQTRKNITTYAADGSLGKKHMRKPMPAPALSVDHTL